MRSSSKAIRAIGIVATLGLTIIGFSVTGNGNAQASPMALRLESQADVSVPEATGLLVKQFVDGQNVLGYTYDENVQSFVIRTPRGAGITATVAQLAAAIPAAIKVGESQFTKSQLTQLQEAVSKRDWSADAKEYAYGVRYDATTDTLRINGNFTTESIQPLVQKYWPLITLSQGPTGRATRELDPAPHHGGTWIVKQLSGGYVMSCTAGFAVAKGTTRYLVTAGHCYSNGSTIKDYYEENTIGTVTAKASYPAFDMELIAGSTYSRDIYNGSTFSDDSRIPVLSAAAPVVGSHYCWSGSQQNKQCGKLVVSTEAELCDDTGCTTSLVAFTGGSEPVQGDSGAPFYYEDTTPASAKIRGMVIGYGASDGYAENWISIKTTLGVSIVTTTL